MRLRRPELRAGSQRLPSSVASEKERPQVLQPVRAGSVAALYDFKAT